MDGDQGSWTDIGRVVSLVVPGVFVVSQNVSSPTTKKRPHQIRPMLSRDHFHNVTVKLVTAVTHGLYSST